MDPYKNDNISPLDIETTTLEVSSPTEVEVVETVEEQEDSPIVEMGESLYEHISDLRKQLIKSVIVFIAFFIFVFATINYWFPYVTRGYNLVVLGPLEVIKFYTSISAALALGLSLPFLIHFIWRFVKPGLLENETKFLGLYAPVMFLLFIAGVAFGYFVVNPLSFTFLMKLGAINFDLMITAGEYVRFLLMTTIPLGLLFQLPIVTLFLASIGILSSVSMKKIRKWSYVIMALLSALITPPDFISQLLVLIPMIVLYEISIFLVKLVERRQSQSVITT